MRDFITNLDYDLIIENGDFLISDSEDQNQKHIMIAEKGEYKAFPEVGVGVRNMLNDEDYIDMLIEAKRQLEYDGMKIKNISFTEEGKLRIEGNYK